MMRRTIPLSFSDSEFPIPMPQQIPSFFNPVSGYSDSTRYAVPVQHNPLLSSNWVSGDTNFLSECKVRAMQSLQRHFKPCPPPPRLQPYQMQQQVQPMHKILTMYLNYKYKIKAHSKSQQEFLNSLHLTVCQRGICKCDNHRLLILHFEKCEDTTCSICGPVRLVCFSTNQEERFSGGVDYRGYVAEESQPVCKPRRIENTVQNNRSLHAITGHHSDPQSSEGPIHIGETDLLRSSDGFDDNKKMGNENPLSSSQGVVEMQETGYGYTPHAISYDSGSSYDDIWDLAESEDLKQSASKEKISGSIGRTLPNEIEASHGEEINTVVEMQETGYVDVCQVKGRDECLNSDDQCDIANSGKKPQDLKQTTLKEAGDIGECLLSSSYDFDDINIWSENAFFNDGEINKFSNYDDIWDLAESEDLKQSASKEKNSGSIGRTLPNEIEASHGEEINTVVEMQETEFVVACQVKGCDESLNSDDQCDIANSGKKSEDLKQTTSKEAGDIGERLLSSSYDFNDINIWVEISFSNDGEINKFLEKLEVERMCTGVEKSNGQSLKSDDACGTAKPGCQSGRDSGDLKVSGASLIDSFTLEQIKEHLRCLNKHTHLASGKGLAEIRTVDKNTCQLCKMGGRKFCPPPMYCFCCEAQIKPGVNYYKPLEDGTSVKHSFCTSCFRVSRCGKGNISFRGLSFSKARMEKCKHDEEVLEGWVQCDNCKGWQHQICALYNSKQDSGGDLEYVCPFCRLIEIEKKVDAPIRPAFGARDLPRTRMSDFIEKRLSRSLEKERKSRAESLGKSPEEVPGAEDLVVRVVLASNKQLKVKQEFLDILPGETYPTEFPYKSKMLLLFQKFEGVDVCIFAMYLQEFGSECGHPNNRSIYLSYLDSVKYFRPEIKTVDGVALRTFVYQQILIGYLDYCKQLGFAKCYIWACPPSKGEDYILYCHPETQKTPNPHKLIQWYKKMLRKAKEERVVVEYTNFYESFFVPSRECNSKITTARLPYFDGDYLSSSIGNMIRIIDEETKESEKKIKTKTTKRALRAMGYSQGSDYNSKDMQVMQKLGQVMLPSKEEFFVVHLQFTCSNCHEPILSRSRLSCNQCSKFHLCHRCTEVGRTHASIHGERHQLFEVRVNDAPADTEDGDIVFDNDLFNDRLAFLMFCQENHYQFDSLRRAKHSSMMILYHLCCTQYIAQRTLHPETTSDP